MKKSIFIIIIFIILSSISYTKSIYGYGIGNDLEEAKKSALNDLSGNIMTELRNEVINLVQLSLLLKQKIQVLKQQLN